MPQTSYDPLSPTPYQAEPVPPQPAPPQPAEATPSPFGGQPGFQFEGHGNISKTGAIAGVLDNVMRGYVNGKAMGEAKKSLQLKKKSDDLNTSYTADATRLWTLSQKMLSETGKIDTNSDEWKQAKAAVDGSWGAMQDFRGSLLDDGKKKGKGKQDTRTPAEIMADPKSTPQEKIKVAHEMSQKLGAPILGQIQNYAAQAQARAQNPQVQDQDIRAKANLELSQLRTQKEPLTEAQQARAKQLEEYLAPAMKVPAAGADRYEQSKDDKSWWTYKVNAAGDEIPGTRKPYHVAGTTQETKVGSFGDFMKAGYGDAPTQAQYAEGRALWAKAGAGTTTGEHVVMVPQKDGSILPVTVQTTSTKSFSGAPTPSNVRADANQPTRTMATPNPKGLISPGNLPIDTRPTVQNGDGTHSTEFSISMADDQGREVLIPTVVDGKFLTPDGKKPAPGSPEEKVMFDEAWKHYEKTGENLGIFENAKDADAYAGQLHDRGNKPRGKGTEPEARKQLRPVPKDVKAQTSANSPHGSAKSHAGVVGIGSAIGAHPAAVDALDKETNAQYRKAVDDFNKLVDGLNDPTLKLTADQKDAAKRKYYERLQETNRTIGEDHSQRMRDLGLIPAEDSSAPNKDSLGIL